MKSTLRYLTKPYLSECLYEQEKARGTAVACLLAIPSMLIVILLHVVDHKPFIVIIGDLQFLLTASAGLLLIYYKKPVTATSLFVISLVSLVVLHNLINDWLMGENLTHFRILETLIVFSLCQMAVISFIQRPYQLFFITAAGALALPLHYLIIVHKNGGDMFEADSFTFLLTYMIIYLIFGFTSYRMLSVFGRLLSKAESEAEKIRTYNMQLEQKVEERTRELQTQYNELKKVNSELDRFVYSASHDLRAPLTSVLGLVQLIRMEDDPQRVREYADLQEQSVRKLDLFIQDIVNISKNARTEMRQDEIDFKQLLDAQFAQFNYINEADKVRYYHEINQQAPFYSDRQRVNMVLSNLLSNAFRYASPHRRQPLVRVKIEVLSDYAMLEVEDNGQGIAEEHINKIFDMFFRVRQTGTGSGLGLYIVKETLDKLGGEISVSSTLGKGTIFTVKIPSEVPCHSLSSI